MSEKQGALGRLIHSATVEAVWYVFWTYVFPPLFGVVTALFGLSEHQPVMWVLATGVFAFAMMSFGLLAFSRWRFWSSAEHKVIYARLMVNRFDVENKPHIMLGFVLKNTADFPVEAVLTKISTSLMSRIPTAEIVLPRKLDVDAGSEFYFTDTAINISGIADETMTGTLEFEVEYGRPGGRKYKAKNAQTVFVPLDITKPFSSSAKLKPGEQPGR